MSFSGQRKTRLWGKCRLTLTSLEAAEGSPPTPQEVEWVHLDPQEIISSTSLPISSSVPGTELTPPDSLVNWSEKKGNETPSCLQSRSWQCDEQYTGGLEQGELAASAAFQERCQLSVRHAQGFHRPLGVGGFSGPCLRTKPTWEWKNF